MFIALGVAQCFSVVCLKFLSSLHLVDISLKFEDVEMNWKGFCCGKGCSGKEVDLGGRRFCKLHQEPEHPPAVTLGHSWAVENCPGTAGTETKQQKAPWRARKTMTSVNWGVSVGEAASRGVTFYRKQQQAAGLGLARQAEPHTAHCWLCAEPAVSNLHSGAPVPLPFGLQAGDVGLCNRDEGGKYPRGDPGALTKGMF